MNYILLRITNLSHSISNRSLQKQLQQHLFSDANISLDAIKDVDKENDITQPYGQNNSESPQTDYMNSQSMQNSPIKSIELSKLKIQSQKFNFSLNNSLNGFGYFQAKDNFSISEEGMDQIRQVVSARGGSSDESLPKVWRYKFFNILIWLSKYIRYVRLRLIQFHPNEYLSQLHFNIIGDCSYYVDTAFSNQSSNYFINVINKDKLAQMQEEKSANSFQKSLKKSLRSLQKWGKLKFAGCNSIILNLIRTIKISQTFFKIWDILMMFILLAEIVLISFQVSFNSFLENTTFNTIQIPFLSVLSFDIILCFFKGYSEKGVYQTETLQCIKNYLKGNFILDLVCLLIYFIAYHTQSRFVYSVFILRLIQKCYRYKQGILETFHISKILGTEYIKLLELVLTIFLFSHLFSCLWYRIGEYSYELYYNPHNIQQISWVQTYNLNEAQWQQQYIASIFWVFTTMTTIGFGDIVPQNSAERLVAVIIMIFSCFIFAYSVNAIGVLLNSLNEKESIHHLRLSQMNLYMSEKRISDSLQSKIRCYLDYLFMEEKKSQGKTESALLDVLNKSLKDEILVEANSNVLVKMKIFFNDNNAFTYSTPFLQELTKYIQEKFYFPDDVIVKQGSVDQTIYFISKGEIKIQVDKQISDQKPTVLQLYQSGQSFGHYNFFTQQRSPYSSIATSITTVKYLKYTDFERVIQKFPADFVKAYLHLFNYSFLEKYCMLSEYLQQQGNFDILNITCSLCTWGNHQEIECPLINYKPERNFIIGRADYSKPMSRHSSYQRKQQKIRSFSILQIVKEQAQEFQEDKGFIEVNKNCNALVTQNQQFHHQLQERMNPLYKELNSQVSTSTQNIWNTKAMVNFYSPRVSISQQNQDNQKQKINSFLEIENNYLQSPENIISINDLLRNVQSPQNMQNNHFLERLSQEEGVVQKHTEFIPRTVIHQANPETMRQIVSLKDIEAIKEEGFPSTRKSRPSFYQTNQEPLDYVNSRLTLFQWIKGETFESDKHHLFNTYRYEDNYVFHIQKYNLAQERKKSRLRLQSIEKKPKKRKQSTLLLRKSFLLTSQKY